MPTSPAESYNATASLVENHLTGAYTSLNCPRAVARDLGSSKSRRGFQSG
jgi:hypothetical protein